MVEHSLKTGQILSGYKIENITALPSIDSELVELTHIATKSKHLHILNSDKENTFSVIFRTVPKDSSGVAHILEHTVLCGSKKYNVRDPFFSMIKRSLSTFMNAFTSSDWTMYPFSSQNKKDYYNLMDVYLDATFFPNLDELSFKQEGHRLELSDDENQTALEYKGVVYNEMLGAMSSPGQVMGRSLLSALYPDTTYQFNSGGEPSDIPNLTWQGLKDFHAMYYHPSNACFYTYGNLDLADTLSFINDKVLSRFTAIEVDSQVPAQPRWNASTTVTQAYAFDDAEKASKKYQACLAWLTCEATDTFEILALTILEQILIGNSASPLRKALIDANLGSALSDSTGFEPDNRDAMFACGLKDIKKEDAPKVEKIIMDTLNDLASNGIEKDLIDSAVHQIEFHRKEITNTPYPFGIKLLLSFTGAVIHEGNVAASINIDDDLARLMEKIEQGPFLESRLKKYFIDNPHRVLFILEPDTTLEKERVRRIQQELAARLAQMSDRDLETITADAKALEALQESEEDLSVLPTLELEDVPPEIEIIHPNSIDGVSLATSYDKATSGILYFTCPMGAGTIDPELYPLVPFFCKAFTNSGTKNHTYDTMAKKMDLYTGGIAVTPFSGSYFSKEADAHSFIALQGKVLDRNIEKLFDLVKEYVESFSFNDYDRLKNLLMQYQAGLESSIVSTGHRYAISLASKHLSQASYINELWHGIAQYQLVKSIVENMISNGSGSETLDRLCNDLNRIAGSILKQDNLKPALIGDRESILSAEKRVQVIHGNLPKNGTASFATPSMPYDRPLAHEGWYTNTSVSFVGQSFRTVRITHEDSPGLAVISKILRAMFLHREIREKGGAYGGFALYNSEEGIFSFASYRDPHIQRTLDVYKKACDFIINGEYSQTDVKEAILQVCSEIDKPETPGPAAMKAFYRKITKFDDEIRQSFKDALLKLDKSRIQKIAQTYFDVPDDRIGTAVISNKDRLEEANAKLSKPLTLNKI